MKIAFDGVRKVRVYYDAIVFEFDNLELKIEMFTEQIINLLLKTRDLYSYDNPRKLLEKLHELWKAIIIPFSYKKIKETFLEFLREIKKHLPIDLNYSIQKFLQENEAGEEHE